MTRAKRTAHWLKPSLGKGKIPGDVIYFDVETGEMLSKDTSLKVVNEMPLKLGWAKLVRQESNGASESVEYQYFETAEEFWCFVMRSVRKGRTLYLMAHNANFDLSVLRWHEYLYDKYDYECVRAVLPDGAPIPFHVEWLNGEDKDLGPKAKKRRIVLTDLANYFGLTSLSSIGQNVGIEKMSDVVDYQKEPRRWLDAERGTPDWEILSEYCRRDVDVTHKAFHTFCSFVIEHDLGKLGISAAGQAFGAYRSRFMPDQSIAVHDHTSSMALERQSYLGARVELFNRRGRWEGPIYEMDINSMYPFIMTKYTMPARRIRSAHTQTQTERDMPLDQVMKLIGEGYCLTMRVRLDIPIFDRPVVPIRYNHKLIYPTGSFEAVLTTPELKIAIERGYVRECYEYVLYEGRDDLFTEYVEFFYKARFEYKAQGNGSFEAMCKLMLNSLYGKFGQHNYDWEPASDQEIETLAMMGLMAGSQMSLAVVDNDAQSITERYRNIGGKVTRRSQEKVEPNEGACAIAAHIIAYGRVYLSRLIELVGHENMIYSDTDSLHVTQAGYDRALAASLLDNSELGKLKKEDHKKDGTECAWGEYLAPKCYELEGKGKKIKGVSKSAKYLGNNRYEVTIFRGFSRALTEGDLNRQITRKAVKMISGEYTKAHVAEDGTITPFHMVNGTALSHDEYYAQGLGSLCDEAHRSKDVQPF